jgi:hypothetical protein
VLPGDPPDRDLARCPGCGIVSVEWTLSSRTSVLLESMTRLDALHLAVLGAGRSFI